MERVRTWAPLVLGAMAFGLYALLMPPSIYWLDSGELTAAGASMGVPHPTGFPLYAMLAHLASLVPIGEIGLRVGLLSAACAGLSVAMVCRLVFMIDDSAAGAVGGIGAGALLAVSLLFARQATVAEVYAPTALFLVVTLYLLVKVGSGADGRFGLALALVAGLGIGLHGSYRLLAFWPIAVVLIVRLRHGARWPLAAPALALTTAAGVHAYLPVRAAQTSAALDWGHADGIGNLWSHVRAESIFQSFEAEILALESERWTVAMASFFEQVADSLGPVGLVLMLVGLVWLPSRGRVGSWMGLTLLGWLAIDLVYAVWLNPMGLVDLQNGVPFVLCAAVLAGAGLVALARFIGALGPMVSAPVAALAVVASAWVGVPDLWPAGRGDGPARWAEAALEQAPPGATLWLTNDSTAAPVLYATEVLGARPDSVVLVRQLLVDRERTIGLWRAAHGGEIDGAPEPLLARAPNLWEPGSDSPPPGFGMRPGAPLLALGYGQAHAAAPAELEGAAARMAVLMGSGDGSDRVARQMHAQGLTQLGVLSLRAKGSPEDAAVMFERALAVEPRFVRAWVNIGVIASRRRDLDGAVRATERAVELAPNHVGARINLARYYLGLRKPKAAGLHARRATVLAPKNASAWALASVAARLLGDPDAGALAAEARRIDPNNRDVRRLGTSR